MEKGRIFILNLIFIIGAHIFILTDVTGKISWLTQYFVIFLSFLEFAVAKATSAFTLSSLYCASLVYSFYYHTQGSHGYC